MCAIAVLSLFITARLMAGNPNWEVIAPKPEVHLTTTEAASFKQASYSYKNQGDDRCRQYRRREIAGFVLLRLVPGLLPGEQ